MPDARTGCLTYCAAAGNSACERREQTSRDPERNEWGVPTRLVGRAGCDVPLMRGTHHPIAIEPCPPAVWRSEAELGVFYYGYDGASRKGAPVQRETVPPGEKPEPL